MYESALCSRTKPSKRFECPTETDKKLRFVDFRSVSATAAAAVDCCAQCSHSHARTPHKIHTNFVCDVSFLPIAFRCACARAFFELTIAGEALGNRSSVSMGTSKIHYARVSVKKPGRYTL